MNPITEGGKYNLKIGEGKEVIVLILFSKFLSISKKKRVKLYYVFGNNQNNIELRDPNFE